MYLLDDHSALHNFKQAHGLYPARTENTPSAYILECRLRRILEKALAERGKRTLAREAGIKTHELDHIRDSKVYDLSIAQLRQALQTWETDSLEDMIAYLHRVSVDHQRHS